MFFSSQYIFFNRRGPWENSEACHLVDSSNVVKCVRSILYWDTVIPDYPGFASKKCLRVRIQITRHHGLRCHLYFVNSIRWSSTLEVSSIPSVDELFAAKLDAMPLLESATVTDYKVMENVGGLQAEHTTWWVVSNILPRKMYPSIDGVHEKTVKHVI